MKADKFWQSGQTLVILLVFMAVSITITSAAAIVIMTNTLGASKLEQGEITRDLAEAGAENAILRLLRDPFYTGETLTIGSGTDTIVVTGGATKTITVTATNGNFVRKLQVITDSNNVLNVTSWQEIY